jgi:hypothetical protein
LKNLKGSKKRGKPWYRWEDNIKMNIRKTGSKDGNSSDLAQERVQWSASVNINEPSSSIKAGNFLTS